ncbi:MAG: uridine diphosphate-N-acetylglucosamine-binding protein YvcK [Candidatus Promineifilaceae bacterium]
MSSNYEVSTLPALPIQQYPPSGPRLVAIGGGTGMPSLLRGLRLFTDQITAIVTVADDGGSSGRLRRELGVLPPGDFRGNIAALSRDEELMTQLLQYRFGASVDENPEMGRELQGHAFGNLLLAALTGITGSFDEALLAAQRVLAMRGQVIPSTLSQVTLAADILVDREDSTVELRKVYGESAIPHTQGRIQRVYLEPANVRAYPPALKAIFQADMILIGPGSLYTSILPNLLVPDLAQALIHAQAPKVYISNLATQEGETAGYDVADHVAAVTEHIPQINFDIILANNNFSLNEEALRGTILVELADFEDSRLVTADLVEESQPWRHSSSKLSQAVLALLAN